MYPFLILFWIYNLFPLLIPNIPGTFDITFRFHLWFHAWNLLYATSPQKQVSDVSLVLKDSDTDSE